jgi:putative restriction endonuclease
MANCVFVHRSDSIYQDSPAEQYQFPKQYLGRANACLGDWVVYLEPSKVIGTRGYFGIARVAQIVPDPKMPGMYLALIEPNSYLDIPDPVAFADHDGPIEQGLLNEHGRLSGRAQAAVRPISIQDFFRIIDRGFEDSKFHLPRTGTPDTVGGFADEQAPFILEQQRDRISVLTSRIMRDRVFRKTVLRAYDERCAITGLKLINGGGRAEVDAAHIRPVHANGPDVVCNGIALSGTVHWMFDRGLVTLSDDLQIQLSRHLNDTESVRGFINKTGHARLPNRASERPHPHFLKWHRENCFKN